MIVPQAIVQIANEMANVVPGLGIGMSTFQFKISPLDDTQHAEWTLNKIEITFNGTFAG